MSSPFQRPGDTPQQEGGRFERFWAKFFGREPIKGSGNQWHSPMDVGTIGILFNLKHWRNDKLRFGRYNVSDLLKEADEAAGLDKVGALATSEDGEVLVTFRGSDFLRMAQTGDIKFLTASKGDQKRARSRIPSLLRDEDIG